MFKAKKKSKDSKLKQVNNLWDDICKKSHKRKEDMKTVYNKITTEFEIWINTTTHVLETRQIITTDLLVFEDKLQVMQ